MDFLLSIFSKIIYGGGVLFDLAKWFIFVIVVFMIVNTFFFGIFIVDGASMDPSLKTKEWVFWNKSIYDKENPQRGDIVVMNYPGDPNHKKYVKRIIGLPGERVDIKEGAVFVNDIKQPEDYLPLDTITKVYDKDNGSWSLGREQYFVLGDNRPNSSDSRAFGLVKKRFLLGKAISIIYPRFRLTKDI